MRSRFRRVLGWRLLGAVATLASLTLVSSAVPPHRADGSARMAQRLAQISIGADLWQNSFLNDRRVQLLRNLPEPEEPNARAQYLHALGRELLLAGDSYAAARSLQEALAVVANGAQGFDRRFVDATQEQLVIAFLRFGEQENCIDGHNPDRCLLPIRGRGIHSRRRGSEAAIQALNPLLQAYPEDLGYRWLLNLAYMTLGDYPQGVPERWRIEPAVFDSDQQLPRFPDRAPDLGLDVMGLAGGVVMEDFDGDELLDLMVSGWGLNEPLRLFRNRGDGRFEELTERTGLDGIVGGLNLEPGDYDNDGDVDVLVLRGAWLQGQGKHPNSLLRNEGGGRFSDVTEEAGLLSFHPTQTAAWGDYDNDGWLDVFIGNEHIAGDPHPSELYRNQGDGTFRQVAKEAGLEVLAYVKGCAWGDVDNDGRIDLYVSNMSSANRLYRNLGPDAEGKWRFADITETAGVGEPISSFPTWFFDVDNDGDLDLFVAGYRASLSDVAANVMGKASEGERPRLYRNRGDGTFEDATLEMGLDIVTLPMGANLGDLDGDGWLDMYLATGDTELRTLVPNRMLRNAGGQRFLDVTSAGGFGHLQKGHGVAFGDLDHDGDQDVYTVMGGAHSGDAFHNVLFENPGPAGRWLKLRLEGKSSNRAAIGARLRVRVQQRDGSERQLHRLLGSGGSFGSSTLRAEIGLGVDAMRILDVQIRWPGSAETQLVSGLELDRTYRIQQGNKQAQLVPLSPFELWRKPPGSLKDGDVAGTDSHDHRHHHPVVGEESPGTAAGEGGRP